MPIAFTTTMLAWSMLAFPESFNSSQATLVQAKNSVRWGADYLSKAFHPEGKDDPPALRIAYQVGTLNHEIGKYEHTRRRAGTMRGGNLVP